MADRDFTARSGFDGLLHDHGIASSGVIVTDRSGTGLATVIASTGSQLTAKIQSSYGLALPDRPSQIGTPTLAFVGIGPGRYLAMGDTSRLAAELSGHAAVFDQTDGYALLRLRGPKLYATLAKGVAIDLHPAAFPVGSAASTAIAHIGAILWRLPDHADGGPVFEIAVFRSMAASFWHFLSLSAAEFGLAVEPAA